MKPPSVLRLAVLLAAVSMAGLSARAQMPLYTANATTATPEPGVVHFLQVIKLAQGTGTYTLNSITFSAYFTTADTQAVLLFFYSGVDRSPTSTNALANATLLASARGNLTPNGAVPNGYAFTFTPSPPLTVTTPDGSVGVEVYLLTQDLSTYSSTAYGRFTASAPTVGSADGFVWNDGNSGTFDGVFTGDEQTRFNMANANTRLALTGSLLHLNSFTRSGTTATLTVDSYTGINYQLQRATSLTAGNWTNVGGAVAGSNGTVLTFTDNDSTDPAAFYRVVVTTPAASSTGSKLMKVTRVLSEPAL